MKDFKSLIVLAGLVSLIAAPSAMAGLSLVGVGNYAMPTETFAGTPVTGLSGALGYGAGALLSFQVYGGARPVDIEFGAIYAQTKFKETPSTYTFKEIEIPIGVKIHLNKDVYATVGGYYANGMGTIAFDDGSGGTGTLAFGDFNLRSNSMGGFGGAGFNIPLGGMVALRIEARYKYQIQQNR